MARGVIAYDKELPEIAGRLPWQRPSQHLVKDESDPTGWRVEVVKTSDAQADRPKKALELLGVA